MQQLEETMRNKNAVVLLGPGLGRSFMAEGIAYCQKHMPVKNFHPFKRAIDKYVEYKNERAARKWLIFHLKALGKFEEWLVDVFDNCVPSAALRELLKSIMTLRYPVLTVNVDCMAEECTGWGWLCLQNCNSILLHHALDPQQDCHFKIVHLHGIYTEPLTVSFDAKDDCLRYDSRVQHLLHYTLERKDILLVGFSARERFSIWQTYGVSPSGNVYHFVLQSEVSIAVHAAELEDFQVYVVPYLAALLCKQRATGTPSSLELLLEEVSNRLQFLRTLPLRNKATKKHAILFLEKIHQQTADVVATHYHAVKCRMKISTRINTTKLQLKRITDLLFRELHDIEHRIAPYTIPQDRRHIFLLFHELSTHPDLMYPVFSLKKSAARWKEQALWIEQNLLHTDMCGKNLFENYLIGMRTIATDRGLIPTVFMSYARAVNNNHLFEAWTQSFIRTLAMDLEKAGIRVKIDLFSRRHGCTSNTVQYMHNGIQGSRYVILLGTESLLKKKRLCGGGGVSSAVCTELVLIKDRHRHRHRALQNQASKSMLSLNINQCPHVIPILLSGTYETAFPAEFRTYTGQMENFCDSGTPNDARNSYLTHFTHLLARLYELPKDDADVHQIQETLVKKLPRILVKGLPRASVQLYLKSAKTALQLQELTDKAEADALIQRNARKLTIQSTATLPIEQNGMFLRCFIAKRKSSQKL